MTTFLLIRHASHALVHRALVGRMPDVHLSEAGCAEAEQLAQRLAHLPVAALYVSPLERAKETAAPLARAFRVPARVCDDLIDIDFGDWTGCGFDDLAGDPAWQHWNAFRSLGVAPNGESMLAVQARAVSALAQINAAHAGEVVAVVSHGDIIRAALAHYLGVHLDLFQRMEIRPASVSVLWLDAHTPRARVICLNHTGRLEI